MVLTDVNDARRLSHSGKKGGKRTSFHGVEKAAPPAEFVCPLAKQVMRDPTLLVSSGFSFERSAIVDWLSQDDTQSPRCPRSGALLATRDIVPNQSLRRLIGAWQKDNDCAMVARPLPTCEACSESSFGESAADDVASPQTDEHSSDGDARSWAANCVAELDRDAYAPLKFVRRDLSEERRRALAMAGIKRRLMSWIGRTDVLDAVRAAQLAALYLALPSEETRIRRDERAAWRLSSLEAAALVACLRRDADQALPAALCASRLCARNSKHNRAQLAGAGIVNALLDLIEEKDRKCQGEDDAYLLDVALNELNCFARLFAATASERGGVARRRTTATAGEYDEEDEDEMDGDHQEEEVSLLSSSSFSPGSRLRWSSSSAASKKKKKDVAPPISFARSSRVADVLMAHCERCAEERACRGRRLSLDDSPPREKDDERKNQAKILGTLLSASTTCADVHSLLEDGRVVGYAVDALRGSLDAEDGVQFEIGNAAFGLVHYLCKGGNPRFGGPIRKVVAGAAMEAVIEADGVEAVWARIVALRRSAKANKKAGDWDGWVAVNGTSTAVRDGYRLLKDLFATLDDRHLEQSPVRPSEESLSLSSRRSSSTFEKNVRALAENDDFAEEAVDDDDEDVPDRSQLALDETARAVRIVADLATDTASATAQIVDFFSIDGVPTNVKRRFSCRLAEVGVFDALGELLCDEDTRHQASAACALTALIDASDVCDERARRAAVGLGAVETCVAMLDEDSDDTLAAAGCGLLRSLTDLDEFDGHSEDLQRSTIFPQLVQRLLPSTLAQCVSRPATRRDTCFLVSNCARARREDAADVVSDDDIISALTHVVLGCRDSEERGYAVDALADIAFECRGCDFAFEQAGTVGALVEVAREEVGFEKMKLRPAVTALASLIVLHEFDPTIRDVFSSVHGILQELVDVCDDGSGTDFVYRRARSERVEFYRTALGTLQELLADSESLKTWCDSHNSWVTPMHGLGWHVLPYTG